MSWAHEHAVQLLNDAKLTNDTSQKLVRAQRRQCAAHTLHYGVGLTRFGVARLAACAAAPERADTNEGACTAA